MNSKSNSMKKLLPVIVPWFLLAQSLLGQQKMYWTDDGTDTIQRADLDGSNVEELVSTGLDAPKGIALDLNASKMYWIDRGAGKIQRANLDGSSLEDLVTGLSFPVGIALDLKQGKMYWTDTGTDKIQRADLDGSNVEDLVTIGLSAPHGIALDLIASKMYWADVQADKIQRANLDGSNVEDLVTSGLNSPVGIALDPFAGKMYWVDWGTMKIQRADLDGSNVEDLISSGLIFPIGIALDLNQNKMYWTDAVTNKVQRADLDGSNVEDLVTTGLSTPFFIDIDAAGFAQQGAVVADAVCASTNPFENCAISVDIEINMSFSTELLGSFTATLTWDPTGVDYTGNSGLPANFSGAINDDNVATGTLAFNGAEANGVSSLIDVLNVSFDVIGNENDVNIFDLEFSAMAAANTFTDLLPILTTNDCSITIDDGGVLGDVNNDGVVNSSDALIVLSYDIRFPIPAPFQERIDRGFGDIDGDSQTNSTDSLIILSYDIGLDVSQFPIALLFCGL